MSVLQNPECLSQEELAVEVYRLRAEVARLSRPRTGYCPQCEALARERDAARAAGFRECLALWNDTPLHLMRAKVAELEARYPREAT